MIMSGRRKIAKIFDNVAPALIVPDHFFCNQSSTIVAVYNEPLGEEVDGVTLMFPGDMPTSSPKRVVPRRVGNRTLIFDTPVYSASRGMVEVLPLLNLPSGEVELTPFKISVKHPVRNVMELCLNLSSNDAVLPVLIALMVHCERENGREQFQDPHIDRIMATLVGSRLPGASTNIRDILLPEKKWRRMTLEDLGREFRLREMEKQAYMLKTQRLRWVKRRSRATSSSSKHGETHSYENVEIPEEDSLSPSVSSPAIHKLTHRDDSGDDVQELLKQEHTLCIATEDYDNRSDPQKLAFKAGQNVHVLRKSADGWWYGVSDDKKGIFPGRCVKSLRKIPAGHRRSSSELPDIRTNSLRRNHRASVESIDRPGGQNITDDELRKHPKATYAYVNLSQFGNPILTSTDSESAASDSGRVEKPPTISERIKKFHAVPMLKPLSWHIGSGMSESTGTGLDRLEVQPSAEPLELPRKPQPPLSRQGPTLSSSPLTTAHILAPRSTRGCYHDESSSNSPSEEDEQQGIKHRPQVGALPPKKVPLLPPSHPPMAPSRHAQPPQVPQKPQQHPASPQTQKKPNPVPRPRRKLKEQTKPDPQFEEPEYEDVSSSRPSPSRNLEQHSVTTTHFDVVGEHTYDLPDQLPPRDVPRKKRVPQVGPKPRRGDFHVPSSDSDTASNYNDVFESPQTGGDFLGAQPQRKGRAGSGRQVHFAAMPGATENDSPDQGRHRNFFRTHI